MAETFTDKIKLTKRDSGDINWGAGHNANLDLLDAHAQQGTLRPPRTLFATLGAGAVGSELLGNTIYFYKVTAINPAGETTESKIPIVLETQISQPGTPLPVNIQWEITKGATAYRIYKSVVTGQEKFLAEVIGESNANYTDTGNTAANNLIPVPSINSAHASVRKIIAGSGINVSPVDGTGDVTVSATGGGGGGFPLSLPGAVPDGETVAFITEKYTTPYGADEVGTVDLIQLLNSFDALQMRIRRNSQGYFEIVNSASFEDSSDIAFYIEQIGDFPIYLRTNGSDVVKVLESGITFHSSYTFPASDGTVGQVLSTDGSGILSWINAGGGSFPLISPDGAAFGYAFANGGGNDVKMYFDVTAQQIFFDIAGGQVQLAATGEFDLYANGGNTSVELKENSHEIIFTSQSGQIFGIYGTWIQLNTDGEIRFVDGANYTAIKQAPAITQTVIYELPGADGTPGQVLSTNGTGNLYWAAGGSPGFPLLGTNGSNAAPTYSFTSFPASGIWIDSGNQRLVLGYENFENLYCKNNGEVLIGGRLEIGNQNNWIELGTEIEMNADSGFLIRNNSADQIAKFDGTAGGMRIGINANDVNAWVEFLDQRDDDITWVTFSNQGATSSGNVTGMRLVFQLDSGSGLSQDTYIERTTTGQLLIQNFDTYNPESSQNQQIAIVQEGEWPISFWTQGTERWRVTKEGHLEPETDTAYDVGTEARPVWHLYAENILGKANQALFFGIIGTGDVVALDDTTDSFYPTQSSWTLGDFQNHWPEVHLDKFLQYGGTSEMKTGASVRLYGAADTDYAELFYDDNGGFGTSGNGFTFAVGGGGVFHIGNAGSTSNFYGKDGQRMNFIQDGTAAWFGGSPDGTGFLADVASVISQVYVDGDAVAEFDASTGTDETRFLLWDVTAGTLKRVKRGAVDSGGAGFRALVINN